MRLRYLVPVTAVLTIGIGIGVLSYTAGYDRGFKRGSDIPIKINLLDRDNNGQAEEVFLCYASGTSTSFRINRPNEVLPYDACPEGVQNRARPSN